MTTFYYAQTDDNGVLCVDQLDEFGGPWTYQTVGRHASFHPETIFFAVEPTSTCIHCDRAIVLDDEEGWIDPEAGYDDEDGDGIWRTTCDENHEDRIAAHEPTDEKEN